MLVYFHAADGERLHIEKDLDCVPRQGESVKIGKLPVMRVKNVLYRFHSGFEASVAVTLEAE